MKKASFILLFSLTIIFLLGLFFINSHSTPLMIGSAQSAYPIPDESNYSDFQPLDPYPVLENPTITSTIEANDIPVTNLSVYVSVEGNENEVPVILELVPDNGKTTEYLQLLGINLPNFQVNNGSSRIEIPTIPVGSYQLILSAPDEYFREPRGYLFQVTMDGLSFDNSLPIKFKLIPPNEQELPPCRENQTLQENSAGVGEQNDDLFTGQSICMAEHLTDLSSFPKNPEPRESVPNETLNEGWHYVGPWTTQQNKGVIGRNYVVDPGVFIRGETQFVAERVYAANGENWMEAGWAEVSWRDNKQYVYQFDSTTYEWHFFDQYNLSIGTPVYTKVQFDGNNYWTADIYWNNSYQRLARESIGFEYASKTYNRGEVFTRDGIHPLLPMSRFDLGHLNLTGGVVWELWDGRYETFMSENSPYTCDMEHQFDKFAIHSPVLFLSLIMR